MPPQGAINAPKTVQFPWRRPLRLSLPRPASLGGGLGHNHGMATPDPTTQPAALAALHDDRSGNADALLAELARRLQAQGRRVRGLLMVGTGLGDPANLTDLAAAAASACEAEMVLQDLHTGERYLVSQPLGRLSDGCRGDPQGFARASVALRRALQEAPELVLVNRFGGLEAEGGGFAQEVLDLVCAGVPVLTQVSDRRLQAWQRFSGGAPVLPAEPQALQAWLDLALRQA